MPALLTGRSVYSIGILAATIGWIWYRIMGAFCSFLTLEVMY